MCPHDACRLPTTAAFVPSGRAVTVPERGPGPVVDGMSGPLATALQMAIDLPGRLDAGRLRTALVCLALDEPTVGARYQRCLLRDRWIVEPAPEFEVAEADAGDDDEAAALENEFIQRPFEATEGLPVSALLLHLDGGERLLLRVNHLLADGGGTKRLAYRLASAYRQLIDDPHWRPTPGRPGPRSYMRVYRALGAAHLPAVLRGWFDELRTVDPRSHLEVPSDQPAEEGRGGHRLRLSPRRVARLKARWREAGMTLNDLLLAAFGRALESTYGAVEGQGARISCIVTSDLRKLLPDDDHINNFAELRFIPLGVMPLAPPEENLRRVARWTQRWKQGSRGLASAMLHALMSLLLPASVGRWLLSTMLGLAWRAKGTKICLTNIGPIDEERLDFGDGPCLDARMTLPAAQAPGFFAAATGCAGSVTVSVLDRPPGQPWPDVETFLAALDGELAQLE